MKKEIYQEIEIPEDVTVEKEGNLLKVKGPEGENSRKFNFNQLEFEKKGDKAILGHKKATKREKKRVNTLTKHIENMIKGVKEKFEYQLKICSSHFPMSAKVEGNQIIIKNFLGEKIERKSKIPENVSVEIEKDIIKVTSIDKEKAGQTAANLEKTTAIRGKDRRIFQDGIYIINKAGKEI